MTPRFSLIIPTLNRLDDLRRLLVSMQKSSFQDFEVIVIDQNDGPLLDGLCEEFEKVLPLRRMKIKSVGAAHARNYGFQFARGEIINFPDDDSHLSPALLAGVASHFAENPEVDALFVRLVDPIARESQGSRFSARSQWIKPRNIFSTTCECTMFIKASVLVEVGPLDENLGVGTFYGAEEGSDFVLRALSRKKRLFYEPALVFYHAQKTIQDDATGFDAGEQAKAYNYGKGFGRLWVKHMLLYHSSGAAIRFLYYQTRVLCAAVLYLCMLRTERSRYYWKTFQGRMVGAWLSFPELWKNRRNQPE